MIDAVTHERVTVYAEGAGSPCLMLPEKQLEAVTAMLRNNHVPYWLDEDTISIDGEPAVAIINFNRDADAAFLQQLLDGIQDGA